jgi:hypothetical protein
MTLIAALSMASSTRSTWLKSKTPGFGSNVPHADSEMHHDRNTSRLHHYSDVLIEAVRPHVLLVIGSTEEDRLLTFERLSASLKSKRGEYGLPGRTKVHT